MSYTLMTDEDIIRDIAERVDRLRIEHRIKETEIEESTGISRKTLYNFRQGKTGFSLRNFIRLLKCLGEVERLERMFTESETYSPRSNRKTKHIKRVRDSQKIKRKFQWGDEKE